MLQQTELPPGHAFKPLQFSLRSLLLIVAFVAVLLAVFPFTVVMVMAMLALPTCLAARSATAGSRTRLAHVLLLMPVLIIMELACAHLAYYTLGEVASAFYFFCVGLNLLALLLSLTSLRVGALAALVLALLLIPYHIHLGVRWYFLDREASHLIDYLEQMHRTNGAYPPALVGYRSLYPSVRGELMYWPYQACGYVISYHIGSRNTCHEYSPQNGWSYYPD
jgi:hypothetical protein